MRDSCKKVLFSDALEGQRKSGCPLLSCRQSITLDIKFFKLQDILFTNDFPSYTLRGQSHDVRKAFWLTDDSQAALKLVLLYMKNDSQNHLSCFVLGWRFTSLDFLKFLRILCQRL